MVNLFKNFSIFHILVISLVVRLITTYFFSDDSLTNEWAIIIHNYELTGVFGYYVLENNTLVTPKYAEVGDIVLPTVFMPPLYIYFILFLKTVSFGFLELSFLVIIFQILISLLTIYIFYKLIRQLEDKILSLIISFIFSFFPLNVWIVSQISSITLQIFLIVSFFYLIVRLQQNDQLRFLLLFSLVSALLILTRGEFILFYFLTIFYFFIFIRRKLSSIIISILITTVLISPYLYKNYNVFNKLTLTKSFGYNLLKGNNPNFKVDGDAYFLEDQFKNISGTIKPNNEFEIKLDDIYKEKAINYIKSEPTKYTIFYLKKVLSFLLFDIHSNYPNYYNVFHLLPKLILSILTLVGCFYLIKKKGFHQYLVIYYFCNIFLFSIFFILPRYSLILLPIQILISMTVIKKILRKFIN